MKKLLWLLLLLPGTALAVPSYNQLETVYNPFTGRMDYVNKITSTTLPSGSTFYIANQDTLQAGSTYYVREGLIDYRLGIGTNTPQAAIHQQESIPSFGSNSGVLRLDVIRAFGFFTANILSVYSGANSTALTKEFAMTLFSSGASTQRLDFKNRDDIAVHRIEMMRGGELTSGLFGVVRDNTVNVAGTIGLTTVEVAASTTTPKESAAYYLYRVDASAGAVVVTLASLSLPEIPFGRTQRFCKVDSSTNSVTVSGVALTYTNQCVDFLAKSDAGFTTGSWVQMGILTSTSAPTSAGSGGSSIYFENNGAGGFVSSTANALSPIVVANVGGKATWSLDTTSVTAQGNVFNGASQLVQLNASSQLPAVSGALVTTLNATNLASGSVPNARLDSSSVTLQGNNFNGASQLIKSGADTFVPNANIDSSSVTKQGNNFNGASQLVKTGADTFVPNANIDTSSVTKNGPTITLDEVQGGTARTGDAFDWTNATTKLPNGAAPSLTATGQFAFDTTASQFLGYDTNVKVLAVATNTWVISISSGLGFNGKVAQNVFTNGLGESVTITQIRAWTMPASSTVTYQLDERAFGVGNSTGPSIFSVSFSTANNSGVTTTSFSDNSIAAGSSLVMTFPPGGATGGSPYQINVVLYYLRDRQ